MISILLILILVFGFFMGMKRGFILQLMHLLSFIIAFTVAVLYYKKLAPNLVSWILYQDITSEQSWAIFLDSMPMENAFYNAIAFALIFFGTKIILQIIASMLDFVAILPVLKQLYKLLGAILGFVEVYLILFVLLYVFAFIPLVKLHGYLADSFVS